MLMCRGNVRHVQDGIGHLIRRQPGSGSDTVGDRRSIGDLQRSFSTAWRDGTDSDARFDRLPTKTMSQRLHSVLGRGVHGSQWIDWCPETGW